MNDLKDFFINFLILVVIFAIPFVLFPQLIVSMNELGIGVIGISLLITLITFLAIPSKPKRR